MIIDRLITAIEGEDVDGFAALYADDAVMHEPLLGEPVKGRAAIVEGESSLFRAFGDIEVEVRSTVVEGDVHVAEVVLRATNDGPFDLGGGDIPPTGRRIEVPMVWVLELDATGRIRAERDYFDTAAVLGPLGLAP